LVCILYFDKRIQSHSKFLAKKIRKGYKNIKISIFTLRKCSEIFEKRNEKCGANTQGKVSV
jgi:hypothetical protein